MKLSFLNMLEAVFDSFVRAMIRFWDNRFLPKDDYSELFRSEISFLRKKNEELTQFILESLSPKTAHGNESSPADEEFQSIGRPIETSTNRRKRLEQESLASWNKLVQEAKNDVSSKLMASSNKTIEELEADLGVKN